MKNAKELVAVIAQTIFIFGLSYGLGIFAVFTAETAEKMYFVLTAIVVTWSFTLPGLLESWEEYFKSIGFGEE